jgi:hypothetical protein
MGPLLNMIKIKGHLKCKALCKGGSSAEAGGIRYVAKSFKFLRNYVTCTKKCCKRFRLCALRWILSAEDAEGIRAEKY